MFHSSEIAQEYRAATLKGYGRTGTTARRAGELKIKRREYHARQKRARDLRARGFDVRSMLAPEPVERTTKEGRAEKRRADFARRLARCARASWRAVPVDPEIVTTFEDAARRAPRRLRENFCNQHLDTLIKVYGLPYALGVVARLEGFATSTGERVRGWIVPLTAYARARVAAETAATRSPVVARTRTGQVVTIGAPSFTAPTRTREHFAGEARAAIESIRAAYAGCAWVAYRDPHHKTHATRAASNVYSEIRRARARRILQSATQGNCGNLIVTSPYPCTVKVTDTLSRD